MNKICLLIAAAFLTSAVYSQDIKEVRNYTLLGQFSKAKESLDKHLAVPKNAAKAEGWYYKGSIYNQLSKDSTKSIAENKALKDTAYEALKKYREMDPKAPLLTEQNNATLFDLYVGYYSDLGVKAYMAKDPASAYENFSKGLEVHDYIVKNDLTGSNGYKFTPLDTTLTLYTAIAAGEAKKDAEAITYYKRITDADISDPQYIDAYQILADKYKTAKDKAAFADIIAKGRKNYPKNNEFWSAIEIEEATDGIEKPEIFDKYDELMVKNPENYTLPYNYGVELYRYIYSDEMKDKDVSKYKAKLPEVLKKALQIKPTMDANFLLSNYLYNNSIDIQDSIRKIRGVKPDDVKKKKALQTEADAAMTDAIPFAEAVVTLYKDIAEPKPSEKINYKQSLVILKNIYDVKRDTAKSATYEKLIQETEK